MKEEIIRFVNQVKKLLSVSSARMVEENEMVRTEIGGVSVMGSMVELPTVPLVVMPMFSFLGSPYNVERVVTEFFDLFEGQSSVSMATIRISNVVRLDVVKQNSTLIAEEGGFSLRQVKNIAVAIGLCKNIEDAVGPEAKSLWNCTYCVMFATEQEHDDIIAKYDARAQQM